MALPVRHVRRLLLLLLLPFAALSGAVAAGRIELHLAAQPSCVDGLGGELTQCLGASASPATLLAGALLAGLVVAFATAQLTRLDD